MNKILTTLGILMALFIGVFLVDSCRHEIPIPACTDTTVSLILSKTDEFPTQKNGTITAVASGGEGFKFSLNGSAFQDSGVFKGLQGGQNYQIVAQNSWGCTDTATIVLGLIDPCAGVTVTVATNKTDAVLNQSNGSIVATASGGTGFTYSINGGTFQSSGSFSGLSAGNYSVSAKSSSGCVGTTQVVINSTDPCAGVTVSVSTTQINPSTGQSNGSITATATGGSGFSYSLNNGAFQASAVFTGLASGNYTVTAKNSNGCTGVAQVALGANNPCAGVIVTVSTTQINPTTGQSNGSITSMATGGTGFTYSLNNGAFQASGTFSNLAAGAYTITAKNSNGCLGSKQVTLTAVSACNGINITISGTSTSAVPCSTPVINGTITLTASGSTGFTYNLNGGAYQTSNLFSNLVAGTYTMGCKDVNGCTKSVTVVVTAAPPGPLFSSVRALITSRCGGSGCHIGAGNNASGYNFDNDCSIVTKWAEINHTSVLYTTGWKKMPKSPQTFWTAAEKQTYTNWVNAGHKFTD
jgi:hypothetical protein